MKIFGIGLSRTGTKSLAQALHILGYNILHRGGDLTLAELDEADGGADIAVTMIYKELDNLYPKSKFILTMRDKDDWLASCERKLGAKQPAAIGTTRHTVRTAIYSYDIGTGYDVDKLTTTYTKHHQDVADYFRERSTDLLVLRVCHGETWQPLCDFLQLPIPDAEFPYIK